MVELEGCENDHSFGIIPIYREGKEIKVFLLRHRSGYWGFPKGHPNPGETQIETATRELKEETGLQVKEVLSENHLKESYTFRAEGKTIYKKVSYFIATVESKEFVIDLKEAIEGMWLDINAAPGQLTFKEAQRICREACQFLQGGRS